MAFLGETIEELEKPFGAVRCIKDLVEETLKIPFIHAFPTRQAKAGTKN
jgi:hypothetical protein